MYNILVVTKMRKTRLTCIVRQYPLVSTLINGTRTYLSNRKKKKKLKQKERKEKEKKKKNPPLSPPSPRKTAKEPHKKKYIYTYIFCVLYTGKEKKKKTPPN